MRTEEWWNPLHELGPPHTGPEDCCRLSSRLHHRQCPQIRFRQAHQLVFGNQHTDLTRRKKIEGPPPQREDM